MPWSFFFRLARIWTGLRLGRALLVVALAFGPTLAFSQTVPSSYSYWAAANGGQYKVYGATPEDACSASIATVGDKNYALAGASNGACMYSYAGGPVGYWTAYYAVGGQADCVSGYTYQDGVCKSNKPSCPAAGQPAPGGNTAYGTSATQTVTNPGVCINSCSYGYSSYWTGAQPGQSGGYATEWYGVTSTGASCSGSGMPNAVDSKPSSSCPDRTYSGTVNGQSVCVPFPTQTTGGTTNSTTTDAPASSPAASSSTNTSTSTTCDGTTCTTSSTTVTVGGGGGGGGNGGAGASSPAASTCQGGAGASAVAGTCTTTTTQPQDQYCQQNPSVPQCKHDSASGGADCNTPPSCDGDAISCAILSQQWNTRCDLQKSDDPTVKLGQKIVQGQDPNAGDLPTPQKADASPTDMSQVWANAEDTTYQAQCMPDFDINLPALPGLSGGSSLHFDMTAFCKIGQLIGTLNVLGTLVVCAWMLRGIV